MSRSGRWWSATAGIYAAILRHPFLTGLTDGTLPADRFAYYVTQDALYLTGYAQALAVVAAKADAPQATEVFARHAAGAIAVERQLHESLLAELGLDPADVASARMSPTTRAYTSYLLATAYARPYAEGVAAVLPCYRIYQEVGAELGRHGSPDPRYRRWIETYAGQEFAAVAAEAAEQADVLVVDDEDALLGVYDATSRYEWMFWDAAWRVEQWPPAS